MYARFRQNHWYHGSAFQCVQTIQVNPNRNKVIAVLTLAEPQSIDPTLDPRLLLIVSYNVFLCYRRRPPIRSIFRRGLKRWIFFSCGPVQFMWSLKTNPFANFLHDMTFSIFDEHHSLVSQIIGFCMIPIHKDQIVPPKSVHYFKPFWQRIQCDKASGRPC